MPKELAGNEESGIPQDFVGAAAAEGVKVPPELRAGNSPDPKERAPEVVVAEEKPEGAPAGDLGRRGEGQKKVEFTPEEQQRFNRLYRQVKAQDEKLALQGQYLERLAKDKTEIERKLKEQESKDALTTVREQIRTARDNGDVEREERLRDQLITLTTEIEVAKRVPARAAPDAVPPAAVPPAAGDPFRQLSASDKAEIARWSEAADGSGTYLRPWTKEGNARTGLATQVLAQVLADPENEGMTMGEKLNLVDEQMGTQVPAGRRSQTPVMGANLRQAAAGGTPTITPKQAEVARKLFPHLKPQEAYRAYLDGNL